MSDERYGYGKGCTWHGPLTFASPVQVNVGDDDHTETFLCRFCGLPLQEMPAGDFWTNVAAADRTRSGYEAMMLWSQDKCFPDFDTMQNAYRQAMEGTT